MKNKLSKVQNFEKLTNQELLNFRKEIEEVIENKMLLKERINTKQLQQKKLLEELDFDKKYLQNLNINSLNSLIKVIDIELIKKNETIDITLFLSCKHLIPYAAKLGINYMNNQISRDFINLKTTREGYRNEKEGSFKAKYGEVYEIRNNVRSSIFDNQVIYIITLNEKTEKLYLKRIGTKRNKINKVLRYLRKEISFEQLKKRGK